MIERTLDIATRDGAMTTFIVHPERGGPHPAILFYMDAPAIREELRDMARRLASVGYYVMLPNLYYRSGVMELGSFSTPADGDTRKKMFELMGSLSIPLIMDDTDALVAFLDKDPAAGSGPIGAVGYCMSGQYAINAAARHPDRVAAAASIYGVRLVTDQADSPHLAVAAAPNTEFYVGCAEIDSYAPLEMVEQFSQAVADANAEVELYPKVEHGFAFPQRAPTTGTRPNGTGSGCFRCMGGGWGDRRPILGDATAARGDPLEPQRAARLRRRVPRAC